MKTDLNRGWIRGLAALAGFAVIFTASFTSAQTATLGGDVKPGRALRITISGDMNLSLVSRNSKFFGAALGNATSGAALGTGSAGGVTPLGRTGGVSGSGGDVFFDPYLSVNMNFELAESVNANIRFATPFDVFDDAGGANTTVRPAGARDSSKRFPEVEEAYVDWAYSKDTRFRFGVQDYAKDFTGRGNPFFMDVSHAESAFMNPGFLVGGSALDFGAPQGSSSGLVGTQEAAGALLSSRLSESATIDVFYFTVLETFRSNSDDTLFGVTFEQAFDTGSSRGQYGATVVGLQNDSSSYLWTLGVGGATSMWSDTLELYGEAYAQAGQYIANAGPAGGGMVPGSTAAALGSQDIDQRDAFAFYGGARYYFPSEVDDRNQRTYVDFSVWEVSGDDNGDDDSNSSFISLENNNDTIVVEDGYYGLDIDSNYRAIKLKFGFSPRKNWSVELLGAYFELQDNNGTASNGSRHDKIGDEIDLNVRYFATDYLTFRLGLGWLMDGQALGVGSDISVSLFQAVIDF